MITSQGSVPTFGAFFLVFDFVDFFCLRFFYVRVLDFLHVVILRGGIRIAKRSTNDNAGIRIAKRSLLTDREAIR